MAIDTGKVTLCWPNRVDEATLSGGSWSALFPLNNLIDRVLSKKARTTGALQTDITATNLYLRSQEFNNASWTKNEATITADADTAPDSTVTADKLIPSTNNVNTHEVRTSPTYTAGQRYTISVYAKPAGYDYIYLSMGSGAFGVTQQVGFNLATQVATVTQGAPTYTIEAAANGYYRVSITATATTTAAAQTGIRAANNNANTAFAGDGTSGVYIWGAQRETGTLTTYIPTTSAAVTRTNPATIEADLDMTRPVGCVAIAAHNLSADATWRVRLYSDYDQTQLLYDSGMMDVWASTGYVLGGIEWEDNNFWTGNNLTDPARIYTALAVKFMDQVYSTARSVKVDVLDANNVDLYIEIGRLFISTVFQPTYNMDYGVAWGYHDNSVIEEALDNTEYFDERRKRRTMQFGLGELSSDEGFRAIYAMQRDLGRTREMLVAADVDNTNSLFPYRTFLGRLESLDPLVNPYFSRYRAAVNVREVV